MDVALYALREVIAEKLSAVPFAQLGSLDLLDDQLYAPEVDTTAHYVRANEHPKLSVCETLD